MNKSNEMELDTSDCMLSKRMFMCQNIYSKYNVPQTNPTPEFFWQDCHL